MSGRNRLIFCAYHRNHLDWYDGEYYIAAMRNAMISLKLTPAMRADIERLADAHGVGMSTVVRNAITVFAAGFPRRLPPLVNADLLWVDAPHG